MKKNEDAYLEELEGLLKEDPADSVTNVSYGTLLKQSGKLNDWGELIYHVQKDEYELIHWPFNTHFYPETGSLSAKSFQKLISEKDSTIIAKGKLQVLLLAKTMTPDELLNHKVEFHCRIKCLDGTYISMYFRCVGLDVDKDGDLKGLFLKVLPVSITTGIAPVCGLQLINIKTNKCIFKVGRCLFPKKRLEVLKLTDKGLIAEDIALLLNTTVDNVYGHRKKTLEQTGCCTIHGAINLAREMGLL